VTPGVQAIDVVVLPDTEMTSGAQAVLAVPVAQVRPGAKTLRVASADPMTPVTQVVPAASVKTPDSLARVKTSNSLDSFADVETSNSLDSSANVKARERRQPGVPVNGCSPVPTSDVVAAALQASASMQTRAPMVPAAAARPSAPRQLIDTVVRRFQLRDHPDPVFETRQQSIPIVSRSVRELHGRGGRWSNPGRHTAADGQRHQSNGQPF
jgi:hypothetical protein